MLDSFKTVSNALVDEVYLHEQSVIPEIVYHYTDASGLSGILRTGKIWATDYRFLNDKSEIEYTKTLVRDIITKKIKSTNNSSLLKLYSNILSYDSSYLSDSFIFSLSGDSDDLSQWRGYARDGQGFTVGFCGKSVYDSNVPEDAQFGFVKVKYSKPSQIAQINKALLQITNIFIELSKASEVDLENLSLQACHWLAWVISNFAATNKHKSFHREREWRTVTKLLRNDNEVKVRTSGHRLVRYTEVPLDLDLKGRLPIKRIGIGPGFLGTEEALAVEALCKETGYEAEIYAANTPYRRL